MRNVIALLLILSFSSVAHADIAFLNGFWSTTFDCAEQVITSYGTNVCDGLDVLDHYTTADGDDSSITTDANNPDGSGGRGFRHWYSPIRNNHSSYFWASFPAPQTELWVRWSQRWQPGLEWDGGLQNVWSTKQIYYWSGSDQWFYYQNPFTNLGGTSLNSQGIAVNGQDGPQQYAFRDEDDGWASTQGGTGPNVPADGEWDTYEVYIKIGTAAGIADGVVRYWTNGQLTYENLAADLLLDFTGGNGTITDIAIGANHDTADRRAWEDFDDVAIALPSWPGFTTDAHGNRMIGPLNAGGGPANGSMSIGGTGAVTIGGSGSVNF